MYVTYLLTMLIKKHIFVSFFLGKNLLLLFNFVFSGYKLSKKMKGKSYKIFYLTSFFFTDSDLFDSVNCCEIVFTCILFIKST